MTLNQCIPNAHVCYLSISGSFAGKTVYFPHKCNPSNTSSLRISPAYTVEGFSRDNARSISLQRKSPLPFAGLISHRYKHKSQFTC